MMKNATKNVPSTHAPAGQDTAPLQQLREALAQADAVLIGAGAGLSTAAGFVYDGPRFASWFADFEAKYGFHDMYSGGFYPFATPEEQWAFWSRMIYVNRYQAPPRPVYETLRGLVAGKDYFVLTTNVDHCFQRAGFDKERLFYTQGDYGLWQCSVPCHAETYDNEDVVRRMLTAQGFTFGAEGTLQLPEGTAPQMAVPSELVPRCPRCGAPMTTNLRADDRFVEDEGWHRAAERYGDFLQRHQSSRLLLLELGVGYNTPGIIKYPFWRMACQWPEATYACLNRDEAVAPRELRDRAILLDGDLGAALTALAAPAEGGSEAAGASRIVTRLED